MELKHPRLYIGLAVLAVLTLVGLTSRNPNVIIAVAVIAVISLGALGTVSLVAHRRQNAWARALRSARWAAESWQEGSTTAVGVRRRAVLGDRSELLGEQVVASLPETDGTDGSWDAAFAQALGFAENRAIVRNSELSSSL